MQAYGKLIVFEGIAGSGKSTIKHMVEAWLKAQKLDIYSTAEPTHGVYGTVLRRLWYDGKTVSPETWHELFTLDRSEHVAEISRLLESGTHVLTDRYIASYVNQWVMGVALKKLRQDNAAFPKPDLMLLFDCEADIAYERVRSRGTGSPIITPEYLKDLNRSYRLEFGNEPYTVTVDASGTIQNSFGQVFWPMKSLLGI